MNEQPEFERSEIVVVLMRGGMFYAEDEDGKSTTPYWTESVFNAKRYCLAAKDQELREPSYYQGWPLAKEQLKGARMVRFKINSTFWFNGQGPIEKA